MLMAASGLATARSTGLCFGPDAVDHAAPVTVISDCDHPPPESHHGSLCPVCQCEPLRMIHTESHIKAYTAMGAVGRGNLIMQIL